VAKDVAAVNELEVKRHTLDKFIRNVKLPSTSLSVAVKCKLDAAQNTFTSSIGVEVKVLPRRRGLETGRAAEGMRSSRSNPRLP
jgi:hypothetical protein